LLRKRNCCDTLFFLLIVYLMFLSNFLIVLKLQMTVREMSVCREAAHASWNAKSAHYNARKCA